MNPNARQDAFNDAKSFHGRFHLPRVSRMPPKPVLGSTLDAICDFAFGSSALGGRILAVLDGPRALNMYICILIRK